MKNIINFSPFPLLHSQRLHLRKMTLEDSPEILVLRGDKRMIKYVNRPLTENLEDAEGFIKKINKGIDENKWIYWGITLAEEGKIVGSICLWNIPEDGWTAELGYELGVDHQGKGIMTEAIAEVLDFGFKKMNLRLIEATPHKNNFPSIRLLKKFNFVHNSNWLPPKEDPELLMYELSASK